MDASISGGAVAEVLPALSFDNLRHAADTHGHEIIHFGSWLALGAVA